MLGAGLGLLGAATPAHATTLAEALAQAYVENPTLLVQRAALRATDEGVPQALSGWRPTVTATVSAGLEDIDSNSSRGLGAQDTLKPRSYGVSIVQPIFQGGRTVAAVRRAELLVEVDRARLAEVEQTVFVDVVTAYMNMLREQAVLDLAISNEQRLKRQLESAKDRFDVGEVTRTDVAQAQSRLSVAVADRVKAQSDLVTSRAAYLGVVGVLPTSLSWPDPAAALPNSEIEGRRIATVENPTLIRVIKAERAAQADVREALGVLYPELNLRGSYDKVEDTSTFITNQDTATLTAELTVPLYQSGAEHARVRAAREVASQRRVEIEQARRSVLETVTQWWESLQTARAQKAAFTDAERAAKIALEGVEQEAKVGARTTLDVLDAEQELFNAQVDLVRARRDELVSSYGLLAAIGRLTAKRIGLDVATYDAGVHYRAVRGKLFGTDVK